eukprot:TRINITY_DN49146_c0_g1_i1.p1 TRINITY_DN49146_c0_g1~~TRINITY_DN49146_c0_g1_i1.p1  ORF type:complete len:584 (-),score=89.44 TRINITY_DN49146_c0_g1_i1:191-1942(-)
MAPPWRPFHGLHGPQMRPPGRFCEGKGEPGLRRSASQPGRTRRQPCTEPWKSALQRRAAQGHRSLETQSPPWGKTTKAHQVEKLNAEAFDMECRWLMDLEKGLPLQGMSRSPSPVRSSQRAGVCITSKASPFEGKETSRRRTPPVTSLSRDQFLTGLTKQVNMKSQRHLRQDGAREATVQDDFYKGVEAQQHEENIRSERQAFEATLLAQLTNKTELNSWPSTQDEEDLLQRAVRMADLDPGLRIRAVLGFAKSLARPGRDAATTESYEFEAELSNFDSMVFLQEPAIAFDLSQICRESLGLTQIADRICSLLVQEALKVPNARQQMCYVLLDLAEWCQGRGDSKEGNRLWELARSMPPQMRDPRAVARHYGWRFDSEPGVPQDLFECRTKVHKSPMMWPLLGPERHCHCCLGARRRERSSGKRSSIPDTAKADELAVESAVNDEVRRELRDTFNMAGSMVDLASGASGKGAKPSAMVLAKSAAQRLVHARRFKVNVVDTPDASDGVAEAARKKLLNDETRRTNLCLDLDGSALSLRSQSDTSNQTSVDNSHELCFEDSDYYFLPQYTVDEDEDDSVIIRDET